MTRLLLACVFSVLFTTTVHALDYTGTATLDWSSLRFSGIPVTAFTPMEFHGVNVVNGPFGSLDAIGQSGTVPQSASLPSGSAFTSSTEAQIVASATLIGEGSAQSDVARQMEFSALDSGLLTVHINYHLTQAGIPPLQSGFTSQTFTEIGLLGLTEQSARSNGLDGTLSVTQAYHAGDIGQFVGGAHVMSRFDQTGPSQSVPLPGMLWPTAVGLIGVAWVAARRRKRAT